MADGKCGRTMSTAVITLASGAPKNPILTTGLNLTQKLVLRFGVITNWREEEEKKNI
jgi:hypothetical protein